MDELVIVIIGGGIAGLNLASHFQTLKKIGNQDVKVVVYEKENGLNLQAAH